MDHMLARVEKLKNEKACRGENEITFLILGKAVCEVFKKILTMVYPRELTNEEIVRIIKMITYK